MAGRRLTRRRPRARSAAVAASVLVISAGILLGGCGGDEEAPVGTDPVEEGALSVRVEPERAARGDALRATVVNGTDTEFTYDAAYELERQIDGVWRRVKLPPTPVIQIAYIAPPGEEGAAVDFDVPDNATPGTWRVVIARNAPGLGVLAGEFEVSRG